MASVSANEISLKEYFDVRLSDLETRTEQARVSMEKRLDGMNEFRDALRDQSSKSPTRIEVETKFDALEKEIKTLNTFKDTLSGKASQSDVNSARLVAVIGLVMAILSLALRMFGI